MPRAVSEPQGSQADACWRGTEFGNLQMVLHKFCLVGAKVNSLTALAQFRRGCKPARACAAFLYHSKEGSPKLTILQPFLGDCQTRLATENSRAIGSDQFCAANWHANYTAWKSVWRLPAVLDLLLLPGEQ